MTYWFTPPVSQMIAGGLLGVAILSGVLCVRRFLRAWFTNDMVRAHWLLRTLRCLLMALTAAAWAAAFWWNRPWLLIIGLVILGQELYEGAVLGALLRSGRRLEQASKPCR